VIVSPPVELAADAALPFRDVLFDIDDMSQRLRSALATDPSVEMTSLELVRVNYQPGRSLRAVYRADACGVTRTIAARMFPQPANSDAVYRRSLPVEKGRSPIRATGHDTAAAIVFWVFPNDRKIAALGAILDPSTAAGALGERTVTATRLVAYAPEKSATLVCETAADEAVAYVKVTADGQTGRDHDTYASLRAALDPLDPTLHLPVPLHYAPGHQALWIEAVEGRRLAASLGDEIEVEDLERLGSAVAVFHRLSAPRAQRFDRFAPSKVGGDVASLCLARPDLAATVSRLAARLSAAAVADADLACLHGDLHPKNAIAGADRITLIDLEGVAIGPAAADIGSLLAALVYRRETLRLTAAECRARAAAFLSGYAQRRGLPSRESLAWHTAAALFFERTVRAVKRIRPLGLGSMPALLSASERLLDRGLEVV
jgi:tRNA A-37 threonylcarbamoyl transferase component Bud32